MTQAGALLAVAGAALLVAGQVAGRAVRDALFLSSFGSALLPYAMIGASLLSIGAAAALSASLGRRPPNQVAPVAFGLNAAFFALESVAIANWPGAVAIALYLQVSAMLPVLGSAFWSLINERFDPYSAKQIVPRMAAAGALAGVVGGVAAERIGTLLHVGYVLPMLAAFSLGCALSLSRLGSDAADSKPSGAETSPDHPLALVKRRPLLRQMAILIALTSAAETLVEYAIMAEASRAMPDTADLVRFFSAFYVICGLLAFALQATVGSWLLRFVGLAGSIAVLPGAVAVSGLLSIFVPKLWTVVLVRAVENITWGSAFQSGFELLYTPLPPDVKRRVKSWIDVSIRAVGSIAGALVVLGLVTILVDLPVQLVMGLAVAACGFSLISTLRIHGSYVAELAGSLRQGVVDLSALDVADATTAQTLANAQPGQDRHSLLDQIEQARARLGPGDAASAPRMTSDPPNRTGRPPDEGTPAATPSETLYTEELIERLRDLASGESSRVRHALHSPRTRSGAGAAARAALQDRLVAAHTIPLLARAEMVDDASDFLRRVAPRALGLLVDGLLDRAEALEVRVELARLLSNVEDSRALDGLWRGLEDPSPAIRMACARGAVRLTERGALEISRDVVHARIEREVEVATSAWEPADEPVEFVCLLLALRHGRHTMSSTLEGLRGGDPSMRGTALEFFESVLPPQLARALLAQLGVVRDVAV